MFKTLARLAGALLFTAVAALAHAAYPDKPIRLVVPYPAGSPIDLTARVLADGLSRRLKESVIVENRPGASGAIAAEAVSRAQPDGYTILVTNTDGLAINPLLVKGLRYDAEKFEPIGMVGRVPGILSVRAELNIKNGAELIAAAKKSPGSISFGSWGQGSLGHLAGALMESTAGISLLHVPYTGAAPALQALVSGQVDLMFVAVPLAGQHVKAGKIRMLGAMAAKRVAELPDLPTLAEQGFTGYEWETWIALVAPHGTPVPILDALNKEVNAVVSDPQAIAKLRDAGIETDSGSRAKVVELAQRSRERWRALINERGIKLD